MNKYPYEPTVINLVDFLAYLIKKAVYIIGVCFICALIVLCYHFFSANTEKAREGFSFELNEYNDAVSSLSNRLDTINNKKRIALESIEKNPIFDMVKEGIYSCKISFGLSSENDIIIVESGAMIYPSIEKLMAFYDSIDLGDVVGSNLPRDILQILLNVSADKNNITILAYGDSPDVAQAWGNSIYSILSEFVNSQKWIIQNKTENTGLYEGHVFIDMIEKHNNELTELNKESYELSKELKEAVAQKPHLYHFLKFFVIGFFSGGMISVIVFFLLFLKRNPVTKSFGAEKKIGKPFLGAMFADRGLFDVLSRSMIGERRFSSESMEIQFINNNIKIFKQSSDIVCISIVSSSKGKKVEKQAKVLESVLVDAGFKVSFVEDVSVNPESVDLINNCDAILLLERQWYSQWRHVSVSLGLAERFNKQVIGFVLC